MGAQSIDQANVYKFSIALTSRVPEEQPGASLTVDHVECMCFEALGKTKAFTTRSCCGARAIMARRARSVWPRNTRMHSTVPQLFQFQKQRRL